MSASRFWITLKIGCSRTHPALWAVILPFAAHALDDDPDEKAGPVISVDETSYDLGVIFDDRDYTHTFIYRNLGNEDLHVLSVKGDCTCITQLISDSVIPPGAEGKLQVHYRGTDMESRDRSVVLETNDPVRRLVAFKLTGTISRPVEVEPTLIDLGEIEPGVESRANFRVRIQASNDTVKINSIRTSSDRVLVEFLSEEFTSVGRDRIYETKVRIPEGVGFVRETISLETSSNSSPLLEVQIRGRIQHVLSAMPPRLVYGFVDANSLTTASATVTPRIPGAYGDGTLRAVCADPRVHAEMKRDTTSGDWTVIVTFTPGEVARELDDSLRLLDSTGRCLGVIPVYAFVNQPTVAP